MRKNFRRKSMSCMNLAIDACSECSTPDNMDFPMTAKGLLLATLVAGIGFAMPAAAADRHVEIINKTGMNLKHFYASVMSADSWEEDILGQDILEDGETFDADIDDGSGKCKYDFKGVFENGESLIQRGIDVCKTSTYTYTR